MSVDRSARNALAALFLVAALFFAMNQVITNAPAGDWWLPLVLFVVGAALVFSPRIQWSHPPEAAEEEAVEPVLAASSVQTYRVTPPPLPAPRLHTMTIRPDPELAKYNVSVHEATRAETVIPFMESPVSVVSTAVSAQTPINVDMTTPVSPETPAPAAEPEPEPDTEPMPMSPETPTPEAPEEPAVMSPETPAPIAPAEVVEAGPSQRLPVDRTPDVEKAAPDLKYTARTEYADPDSTTARKEPAAIPPPDESVTATQRTAPEKETVAEKMSAPQQPYEAGQVGEITPERADRIMDESTDNAHDGDVPVVTEAASPRISAQEMTGEGTVGSASDLTKLNGIGRKSAEALKAAGIDSFHKLANSSDEAIRAALSSAGVRLVGDVNTWAQQAAYAARGDWQGLQQFNAQRRSANGD